MFREAHPANIMSDLKFNEEYACAKTHRIVISFCRWHNYDAGASNDSRPVISWVIQLIIIHPRSVCQVGVIKIHRIELDIVSTPYLNRRVNEDVCGYIRHD